MLQHVYKTFTDIWTYILLHSYALGAFFHNSECFLAQKHAQAEYLVLYMDAMQNLHDLLDIHSFHLNFISYFFCVSLISPHFCHVSCFGSLSSHSSLSYFFFQIFVYPCTCSITVFLQYKLYFMPSICTSFPAENCLST
jgi:hypothetical protein